MGIHSIEERLEKHRCTNMDPDQRCSTKQYLFVPDPDSNDPDFRSYRYSSGTRELLKEYCETNGKVLHVEDTPGHDHVKASCWHAVMPDMPHKTRFVPWHWM